VAKAAVKCHLRSRAAVKEEIGRLQQFATLGWAFILGNIQNLGVKRVGFWSVLRSDFALWHFRGNWAAGRGVGYGPRLL